MLGGAIVNGKRKLVKNFLLYLFVSLLSVLMANISFFNSHFVFAVPWIFFCFLYGKWYGATALVSSFLFLGIIDKWLFLIMPIVLFGIVFVRNILKLNNRKMKYIVGVYVFVIVFICSLLEVLIASDKNYFLLFIMGVVGYWLMIYYCDFYFVSKNIGDVKFDARISSFVLIVIGSSILNADIDFGVLDLSLVLLLFLSFIGAKIGLEVGTIYTLSMLGFMFVKSGLVVDLIIFGYTFLFVFFASNVSKVTFFFSYLVGALFVVYSLNFPYLNVLNYLVADIIFLIVPISFIRFICGICYGSDTYIKRINRDNKKFNLTIADKIIKMEEIFSLVCEKIDVKERIKKNDKKLLVDEVNVFNNLLKRFSEDIKDNYDFDFNYKVEKEFYRYGIDLLQFKQYEDILKNKIISIDVRCEKKEIDGLVVPLTNKVVGGSFAVSKVSYNDVFGYYSLRLVNKKRVNFEYGVSQKSLDKKACGDSYLVYENDKVYVFAISDGMGTGNAAKKSSKLALDLLRKFMDIGFDLKQTLLSMNSILKDKYSKECYSTLDLFVFNKFEGKFYFCKNGASDSYLFNGESEIIHGNKLPLGIVDKLEIEFKEIFLKKGDCLVMASDGVSENNIKGIKEMLNKNSQKLSEIIIRENDSVIDDRTVFVIKIC
jgi:serine/threonine protein phosphatase PrpC